MAEQTRKSRPAAKPAAKRAAKPTAASATKGTRSKAASAPSSPKAPSKPRARAKASAKEREASQAAQKLTTFELDAPDASEVCVAGCFNDWDPAANPLQRFQGGTWRGTISIEPGEHQYRFVVDGEWRDDPHNDLRCWNEYGTENCVLIIQE